ncbi:hypothetical protein V5279_36035 [Bradyrhizobium sp. 26S5]|uniref:hypothetical protein n=1 Tax=Bradyrhizobium sp. 26S5 TaxID=3139729 RepID=UPI0030CC776C
MTVTLLPYPTPLYKLVEPLSSDQRAEQLLTATCMLAGSMSFLDEIDDEFRSNGLDRAIATNNSAPIFDWLLTIFSYQGISDRVARDYAAKHGTASWSNIQKSFGRSGTCPKLRSYWQYSECRFDKTSQTCAEPDHFDSCSLPRLRLRNGRLNQTAYSFFLFVRDVAGGDLLGWINHRLQTAIAGPELDLQAARQEALLGPLRNVYGISDKVLSMALSTLLIGARHRRPKWFETGRSMVTIDTLAHNFLHRTGILQECGTPHAYGRGCYARDGCASIIRNIASLIDCRRFNRAFPSDFPRFVQHAIWRYCAADGLNVCNGNQIDDRLACQDWYCRLGQKCRRKPLK